ncbi:hypothetical protein PPSIR1_36717 [Plesiocystis pacifica SIR-1]|uniref:Uncharacterized protein n=1 Tax=Plesiocystis pacifica SIR-1 TaxID=391625 RepID=A6G1P8_9BACT|nr:hypothetical protein [Plesiocystis pacifica]EDM80312.1 hypothetical protein PPSIR1_36717 [Plesiocystis pacifica SIR-1]
MQLAVFEARIAELVTDLATYHGYRTLWLDLEDRIVHTEPEIELGGHGFRYITTLFQPNREVLTAEMLKIVPVELDEPVRRALSSWEAPAVATPAFAV